MALADAEGWVWRRLPPGREAACAFRMLGDNGDRTLGLGLARGEEAAPARSPDGVNGLRGATRPRPLQPAEGREPRVGPASPAAAPPRPAAHWLARRGRSRPAPPLALAAAVPAREPPLTSPGLRRRRRPRPSPQPPSAQAPPRGPAEDGARRAGGSPPPEPQHRGGAVRGRQPTPASGAGRAAAVRRRGRRGRSGHGGPDQPAARGRGGGGHPVQLRVPLPAQVR